MDNKEKEFREAVALMRQLQKEYFRKWDKDLLLRLKAAERIVDLLLKVQEKETENAQKTLFQ